MGILDYLFGRSPPAPRPAPKVSVRRYDAARPANIAGGFSAAGGLRSPYDNIRWDLRGLIAHSRQQAENNDYMKSWLDAVVRNVIGHQGVRLQNEARDTNGSLDKVANGIIEEGWSRWGRLGTPTVDGGLSWIDMQSLVVRTVARDGATCWIVSMMGFITSDCPRIPSMENLRSTCCFSAEFSCSSVRLCSALLIKISTSSRLSGFVTK